MKYDFHVHVNPKEPSDVRRILTNAERLFVPSLAYYAAKKTFPDWFIANTIGSESIIFPDDVEAYKSNGIIVPALDHDDNNYKERWELAKNLDIPYGGEFSVKLGSKTAHVIVMGDVSNFDPDMYERLLGLNMKEFLKRVADYKNEHKLIVSWAHPFAKTNRDGVPATPELIKEFPYAVELNTTHPVESLALLKILSGEKKHITVGSDSHDPKTVGKSFAEASSFDELLDYYSRAPEKINAEEIGDDYVVLSDPRRIVMFEKPSGVAERIRRIKDYYLGKINETLRNDSRWYDTPLKILLKYGFDDFLNGAIDKGVKKYFSGSPERMRKYFNESVESVGD